MKSDLMQTTGYLVITLPRINYVAPPPAPPAPRRPGRQRLEVASERERSEMDFSRICEQADLPPDLEPAD